MAKRIPRYTLKEETSLLCEAFIIWGFISQTGMLHEEIGELLAVINQHNRNRCTKASIAEKIADVRIRLRQLELTLGLEAACKRYRNTKLDRLHERLIPERSIVREK